MKKESVMIKRSTFVYLCRYFNLIDNNGQTQEELEKLITNALEEKVNRIQLQSAYSNVLKAKTQEEKEQANLAYLELKKDLF